MSGSRRKFRREDPESRRADLIAATLDLMAEEGPAGASVRAIADAAGLSQGMIRHHFQSKEELINAAYRAHMQMINDPIAVIADGQRADERLARYVAASLMPPSVDARGVSLWAAFLHMVRRDPAIRATHQATYLRYRDRLQSLISDALAEAGRPADADTCRRLSIAANAVIDGLWLEGGILPEAFAEGEIVTIGLTSVAAILGLSLPAPKVLTT